MSNSIHMVFGIADLAWSTIESRESVINISAMEDVIGKDVIIRDVVVFMEIKMYIGQWAGWRWAHGRAICLNMVIPVEGGVVLLRDEPWCGGWFFDELCVRFVSVVEIVVRLSLIHI